MELKEIVKHCKKGNQLAFSSLFNSYYQTLYHVIKRILVNYHDVEDVTVITFAKVFKNISKMEYTNDPSFVKWMKKIAVNESFIIDYLPQNKLSVQPADKAEKIIFEGNKLRANVYKNQCRINSSKYKADIRFNDIESLIDTSNLNYIMKIFNSLPSKNRHAYSYHFTINKGEINPLKHMDHKNGDMDFIMLEFGAGTGIVKNQLITDLSAKFALQFNKKGYWKNQFYVSNNLLYMFDNNDKIQLNHFLKNNFSSDPKKTNWIGVELGYLTNRNGDFFGKNTFKLSVNWDIGRYMSISPGLYMTDNFTKFYPGIRLGVGF